MRKGFFSAVLLAGAVSACSLFSQPSQSDWTRASGESDQTSADLRACRQQADAVIRRDDAIDRDIAAARVGDTDPDTTTQTVLPGVAAYDQQKRYDRIVNDCMRQRGYVLPEKSIFE
jgi:hypothetical protein